MIDMIETLMEKGYAYEVNGTVYFRTRKFEEYGKLSHKNLDDLRSGNRSLHGVRRRSERRSAGFRPLETEKRRRTFLGSLHGARAVRAGILSVLSWQKNIWVRKLTFMQAARI